MQRSMIVAAVLAMQASYASAHARAEPVQIQCAIHYFCEYVLEPDETVQSVSTADNRNWRLRMATDRENTVHLLFSIRDDALLSSNPFLTNALIFTDRRNLELHLVSPAGLKIRRPPLPPVDHNDSQTQQEKSQ